MNVVVTPSARERFTPRELSAAYEDYTEHGPQYMNAQTGLRATAYRFDVRVLIVCEEPNQVGRGDASNARGAGGG